MDTLKPAKAEEVREAVADALAREAPLEVLGSGSKRSVGRAMQTAATLDVSGLSGITLYEPEELVLTALPGTTRAEAEAAIAARGQMFAFEPPDLSHLLGTSHAGTLGGMIAANLSGPRRLKSGAVRDHFLGFTAVSGRAEAFQAGGRVMKNVTGYDLPKLMAGSWGTLAVMTSVTLKVLPAAPAQATLLLSGLDEMSAARAMSAAMGSPCEVSGAAHIPADVAPASAVADIRDGGKAATLLRLEGVAPSVDYRFKSLAELLKAFGAAMRLDGESSARAWEDVRDVRLLIEPRERLIWRVSAPPMEGPRILEQARQGANAAGYYDWAGGLLWLSVPLSEHASAEAIRAALASAGGHATLIRAPLDVRASVAAFEPQAPALAALSSRVKTAFDPKGILNPGRLYL
ncbi:MAG: glycolate oxidase subunit GlcE [Parvibaculaceae bacterium]